MDNPSKLRVGVIFGGRSGEHEVSLMSAHSIINALDPLKYSITQIGITHEGEWLSGENVLNALVNTQREGTFPAVLFPDTKRAGLYKVGSTEYGEILEKVAELDVIFPVLHGTFGEDGTLQGLLELQGVAYVGAGVLGSALAMDKGICIDVIREYGIPVVETFVVLRSDIYKNMNDVLAKAERLADIYTPPVDSPYPLFIKPANLGSSVGITKCRNRSDLVEGLIEAARYDLRVLIQRGVNAREIEVSVLGNEYPEASLPGEIIPSREFYSYEAKYIDNTSELIIPAPLPGNIIEQAQSLAIRAFKAIDCAGMARVDFLLDKRTDELFFSEINTIPGFTKISMYPKLWEASGLPYSSLLDRLISLALKRKADKDRIERRYQVS
jgi:D-alanine-D-alanine ligase